MFANLITRRMTVMLRPVIDEWEVIDVSTYKPTLPTANIRISFDFGMVM